MVQSLIETPFLKKEWFFLSDVLVLSPSPQTGEGWGEGEEISGGYTRMSNKGLMRVKTL